MLAMRVPVAIYVYVRNHENDMGGRGVRKKPVSLSLHLPSMHTHAGSPVGRGRGRCWALEATSVEKVVAAVDCK